MMMIFAPFNRSSIDIVIAATQKDLSTFIAGKKEALY